MTAKLQCQCIIPVAAFRPSFASWFRWVSTLWQKIRGGTEFQWVGDWVCTRSASIGISESRRQWAVKWLSDLIENRDTTAGFESGLGRLSFVCSAIIVDRPYLAPLFSYAAAMRRRSGQKASTKNLPPYIKFILEHSRARLAARRTIHCTMGQAIESSVVERFRTDAKAEGETLVVGGYQPHNGAGLPIAAADAKWFLLTLDRKSAPWAYERRALPFDRFVRAVRHTAGSDAAPG